MSKVGLFRGLSPSRLMEAVRGRGVKGTVFHGVRRLGTLTERTLLGPSVVRINPMGFVCNHTCPMCWLQQLDPTELKEQKVVDREKGMKLADYQALFAGMPIGIREINVVGGGEPLVHPDAMGILTEIKRCGWHGSLISNGTLLREPVARRMIEIGWDYTRISVHAGDRETYEKIQGVDRFEILRTNLKTFNALRHEAGAAGRCRLSLFHVLQKDNLDSIPALFQIAEEVGADMIEFDKVIAYHSGMVLSADELQKLQTTLADCAGRSKVPCNLQEILPQLRVEEVCASESKPFVPAKRCSVGYDEAFITALGEVLPCCFSSEVMGNVRERTLREIWFSEKYEKFRVRLINGRFAKYCITNRCSLPWVLHN